MKKAFFIVMMMLVTVGMAGCGHHQAGSDKHHDRSNRVVIKKGHQVTKQSTGEVQIESLEQDNSVLASLGTTNTRKITKKSSVVSNSSTKISRAKHLQRVVVTPKGDFKTRSSDATSQAVRASSEESSETSSNDVVSATSSTSSSENSEESGSVNVKTRIYDEAMSESNQE